jgi:hypothetical protein
VDRVHGRWTLAESHGPPWTGGSTDRRAPGHDGVLAGAWPPATLEHEGSPVRARKRGERGEPISGLTRARAVVWQQGDSEEAVAEGKLSGGGA